jgi:hypothetical protein
VDNETNETYSTMVSSGEDFSIDVPSGSRYVVSIINDGSYVGPVVFGGENTEINTAIKPSEDTALGTITVDTLNGYAATVETPDAVDTDITVNALDGIPLGAGNDGKTKNSGISNGTDSDMDKDGIPNMFDADEDNDGYRNGDNNIACYPLYYAGSRIGGRAAKW